MFSNLYSRPRCLLLVSALVVVFCAIGLLRLSVTADYRVFFSDDNPELLVFQEQEARFYKSDTVVFGVAGDVYSQSGLSAIQWLSEQAWQLPYVQRVDSLSNYQHAQVDGDELSIGDLAASDEINTAQGRIDIRQRVQNEPALLGNLVAEQGQASIIVATVELPGVNQQVEIPEVTLKARNLLAEARQRWPELKLYLFGMVPFNQQLTEATLHDMYVLLPVSFVLMCLVLWWLLRSVVGVLATVAVISASVAVAMGIASWLGLVLNTATAAAPVIIMTLAIAHSVHLYSSFQQALVQEGQAAANTQQALSESLRVNFEPVSLTSLTTIIGFLCLNFSDAPPFREMGNIVALGVLASWWFSLTLLPAIVGLAPAPATQSEQSTQSGQTLSSWLPAFADWVVRRHRPLGITMLLLCLPLIALLPKNELNDVFRDWFAPGTEVRDGMEFALNEVGSLETLYYSLDSGAPDGVYEQDFYTQVNALTLWLLKQPEVAQVTAYTDVLKRMQQVLSAEPNAAYRLPDNSDLAQQFLTVYELSLPFGQSLNTQLDVAKRHARLTVLLRRITANELRALDQRTQQWLSDNAPAIHSPGASGASKMFAEIGHRNIRSLLAGAVLALMAISVLLIFAFRSLRIGLISLVPNVLPAALGFGVWALLSAQINLALSVVLGMTLGIVVDDTIHFLSKYLRARREQQSSPAEAVHYAFTQVGRALWITTLVLITGFMVLALSDFLPTAQMGLLTAITLGMALLADFLLLPPLLIWLDRRRP